MPSTVKDWAVQTTAERGPRGGHGTRLKVLFLSRWFPCPPVNGSKIRVFNLLRALCEDHSVVLVSFRGAGEPAPDPREYGVNVDGFHALEFPEFRPWSAKGLLGFLSPAPRSFFASYSSKMASCIRDLLRSHHYDLVVASQIQMAAYHRNFRSLPALLEEVESGLLLQSYSPEVSLGVRARRELTRRKHLRFLRSLLPHFSRCTVVSEPERNLLQKAVPEYRAVDIVPNAINLEDYACHGSELRPNTLVFAGSFRYRPNYEAMLWFLNKVFPHIQGQIPDVHLTILGDHGGLLLPFRENVFQAGHVEDVRPVIASAAASVVPILSGGGTRLKILESIALGTPVIATSKGAEGLDLEPERHILIADAPEGFAAAVVRLLRGPEHRRRLAEAAMRQLRAKYDWEVVKHRFLSLVESTASASRLGR